MKSLTKTSFANRNMVYKDCPTPVSDTEDFAAKSTCIQIEHSGQACVEMLFFHTEGLTDPARFHNYMQYLSNWSDAVDYRNGSTSGINRPPPLAMLADNTTIQGAWMKSIDMEECYNRYGRLVNSVTMAMPHTGVVEASRLGENGMASPSGSNVSMPPPNGSIRSKSHARGSGSSLWMPALSRQQSMSHA